VNEELAHALQNQTIQGLRKLLGDFERGRQSLASLDPASISARTGFGEKR